MKVLSLFDGMACGMLAMQKAGIEIDRYVAYEIDKYAVQTATHNFPMIEQRGDVFQADFTEYFGFDFLIGGSPCTYWSIAQKNNRETEASGMGWELFSQYVRALHEAKPRFFVYENNKSMAKAIRDSIDKAFGFEAIGINSALLSAQNRQRLYWVGKRNEDGTYSKVPIEQPEDLGILLKDVLESGAAYREKSTALVANRGGHSLQNDIKGSRYTYAAEPLNTTSDGKGRTLIAGYYKQGIENCCGFVGFGSSGVAEPVGVGYRNRREEDGKLYRRFETHNEEKANAITTVQTDSMVAIPVDVYAVPCEWDENGKPTKATSVADGKTYTVYEVKDGKINIKGKEYPIKLIDGYYIIRKLTVRECMRLQTVPEWYEFPVSDSQAYKMLGNGWTVDVITHLLNGCMAAGEPVQCEKKPQKVIVRRANRG